jgi:hypothetical protein
MAMPSVCWFCMAHGRFVNSRPNANLNKEREECDEENYWQLSGPLVRNRHGRCPHSNMEIGTKLLPSAISHGSNSAGIGAPKFQCRSRKYRAAEVAEGRFSKKCQRAGHIRVASQRGFESCITYSSFP